MTPLPSRPYLDVITGPTWESIRNDPRIQSRVREWNRALRTKATADDSFTHGVIVGQEKFYRWLFESFPKELRSNPQSGPPVPFPTAAEGGQ